MKKTLLIALCSIAVVFAACKKPVEPTPTPELVDYTVKYVGNYIGPFTLNITSMNNQPQTMNYTIDSIHMDIVKGDADNVVTATVTVDNESHQTNGTATAEKADFETVRLVIDKPDQHYSFDLNLKMESSPIQNGKTTVNGTFSGKGMAELFGQLQVFDEVSGNITGELTKQ